MAGTYTYPMGSSPGALPSTSFVAGDESWQDEEDATTNPRANITSDHSIPHYSLQENGSSHQEISAPPEIAPSKYPSPASLQSEETTTYDLQPVPVQQEESHQTPETCEGRQPSLFLCEEHRDVTETTCGGQAVPTVVEDISGDDERTSNEEWSYDMCNVYDVAWVAYKQEYKLSTAKIEILKHLIHGCAEDEEISTYAVVDDEPVNERSPGRVLRLSDDSGPSPASGLSFLEGTSLSMILSLLTYYFHIPPVKALKIHINIGHTTAFIMSEYTRNNKYGSMEHHISICFHDGHISRPPAYKELYKELDAAFTEPSRRWMCVELMLEALHHPLEQQPNFRRHLSQEEADAACVLIVLGCVAEAAAPSMTDMERLLQAHKTGGKVPEGIGGRSPGFAPILLIASLEAMVGSEITFMDIFDRKRGIFCFARNKGAYTGRAIIAGRPARDPGNPPLTLIFELDELFQRTDARGIIERNEIEFEYLFRNFKSIRSPSTNVICGATEGLCS